MSEQKLVETEERQVLVTPAIDTSPAGMLAHAMQNGASLEQLEKFMDLKERHEKTEAKKGYVTAMSNFRADCPTIVKTQTVSYSKTNFMHSTLAGTIEQIKSLLAKCGLSHSWGTNQEGGSIKVTCTVTHSGGHSESTSLVAPPDQSGGKNNIQAIGSTVKYLERYTLFAILGLADSENDDDGNAATAASIDLMSKDQAANIRAMLEELGMQEGRLIKWYNQNTKGNITNIESMAANSYDASIKIIDGAQK